MSETATSKELMTTTPEQTAVVKRSKPHLVEVRPGRYICSTGRFHLDLATEFVLSNRHRQIDIPELARTFAGANTIEAKRRVRRNMYRLFNRVLARGEFLIYDTEPGTQKVLGIKVLDVRSERERQLAKEQLERMLQNAEMSQEKYDRAIQTIRLHEQIVSDTSLDLPDRSA